MTGKYKVVDTWDWCGIPQTELEDEKGIRCSISSSEFRELVSAGKIEIVDKWSDDL